MGLSIWQVALVIVLFLLLFGRGRIPQLMGDLAEGIKSFRGSLGDEEARIEQPRPTASDEHSVSSGPDVTRG